MDMPYGVSPVITALCARSFSVSSRKSATSRTSSVISMPTSARLFFTSSA
ncbi:MAG: hypothetical protein PUE41_04370 [bacterium]|nr:hypothetical protein [bacterium]